MKKAQLQMGLSFFYWTSRTNKPDSVHKTAQKQFWPYHLSSPKVTLWGPSAYPPQSTNGKQAEPACRKPLEVYMAFQRTRFTPSNYY